MNVLALALLLQVSAVAADGDSYREARRETTETGRPLVILVGAEWCPACVEMKKEILPTIRRRGVLKRVAFAVVDLDRQRRLGRELTEGGPIPQMVMFRKTPDGWRRRTLIGGQSPDVVERFIQQGIALDEAAKNGGKKKSS
ncbi:MAG: thioredoxin family protein [Pirellulales bacterium]|nr:thioredoxin family protein [Pirellulales bacterium]